MIFYDALLINWALFTTRRVRELAWFGRSRLVSLAAVFSFVARHATILSSGLDSVLFCV